MKQVIQTKLRTGIFLLLIFSSVGISGTGLSAASTGDEDPAVALVNQIRQDPLGYAESLGYDRQTVLQDLPWLSDELYRLEPLKVSDTLNLRSAAYNSEEPPEAEPFTPINEDYAAVGELQGVVSFNNFMGAGRAVAIVVDNQFKKELDPLYEGKRLLLSSEYKLIGSDFRGGRRFVQGRPRNAYFIHIGFASSLLKLDVQVVNMLNQIRANPQDAYKYTNFHLQWLSGGNSPLFLNDALVLTAGKALSGDAVDLFELARYYGFTGGLIASSSVNQDFYNVVPDQIALWMFFALLLNEMKSNPMIGTGFLNPEWNEIGPASFHAGNTDNYSSKMTIVSGRTEDSDPDFSRVYGVIFTDTDADGVYEPGEEVADRILSVYDVETQTRVRTIRSNRAGQFELRLPNLKVYRIQTGSGEEQVGELIYLTEADRYFDLAIKETATGE
ncbi:MAG: hypothetical protein MI862_15435 [Desulfobacterales bacterium]|nr:hypothetical protein [Desulfobacterales bacterium]